MKRHVVLTSGRSGSNHLVAAINQHPELCNFGEVLGPWTLPTRLWSPMRCFGASQARLIETVYSSRGVYYAAQSLSYLSRKLSGEGTHFRGRGGLTSLGVKELFIHLEDAEVLSWFEACEDLSIVHLRREDLLARALSVHRLNMNGRAVTRVADGQQGTLFVDPDSLLQTLDVLEAEGGAEDEILQRLSHHRRLSLVYERDLRSEEATQETLARIHEFLEVQARDIEDTGHRRAVAGRPIEAVENRAELEKALSNSRHAELLTRHQ